MFSLFFLALTKIVDLPYIYVRIWIIWLCISSFSSFHRVVLNDSRGTNFKVEVRGFVSIHTSISKGRLAGNCATYTARHFNKSVSELLRMWLAKTEVFKTLLAQIKLDLV